MKEQYKKERKAITDVCRKLWMRGLVASNDGNISVKLDENHWLCTPSGVSKYDITPEMLIVVDKEGNAMDAPEGLKPSSEMKMHFRCYQERDDVRAVVHAHPPVATAFASMERPLDDYQVMESITNLGAVPVAPFAMPSTQDVPDSIAPFLADHDAILLAHHGALTVGDSLQTAYFRMETLEYTAKITMYIHLLDGVQDMPEDQINGLLDLRRNVYHLTGRHPGYEKFSRNKDD